MKDACIPAVIVIAIAVIDHVTKQLVRRSLSAFDSIAIVPGFARLVHAENPGAAFGFLAEGNATFRFVVLILFSAVVITFLVVALWSRNSSFKRIVTRSGLALILGGAIGNLLDRLIRGTVTDFVELYRGDWSFPAFNVADSAISIGSVLLILDLLRPTNKQAAKRSEVVPE